MPKFNLSRQAIFNVLLPLVLFGVGPFVYGNQSVIFQMMAYLVLAQGINILYGFTGYLPFGYVGFFGSGAYAAGVLMLHTGMPPLLAVLLAGVAAAVLGLVLTPLLRLEGPYFAIGSLAASQIVYYVISNPKLRPITNGPYGLDLHRDYNAVASYWTMFAVVILVTVFVQWLKHAHLGLSLLAIKDDPISAGMAGVHVVRERGLAWLISAFIAGIAGGVFAWHLSVFYPHTVFNLSISIFAIVFTLFGGGATVLGPILGVVVLYGLYNFIGISAPQYFQLLYGLLIVLLVLFLPNGVVSLLRRRGIHVG